MDTEKSAKNDVKAKDSAKSPIDAYKEDYLAAYDRLDKAVATLNADFTQAVAASKETLSASQAEIDKFHKKNAADVVAADKALAAEKSAVEKEIATVKETFAKESADNEAAKKEALAASENRVAKASAAEKKAKEIAEKNKNEKASAAAKANESIKNKAVLAIDAEKKRNSEVVKNRAAKNKSIDDAYAKTVNDLKALFDKDVASLNNDIAAAQNKYLETVKTKTQAYNKICDDKKASFDIKMKAFTEKSHSSDKLVMKEGMKGLKVTQKEFDGDAKTSKSAFDADLAALKAQFVASVPPVEHSIFLRTNKYKIDCLAAENAHIKAVENSGYEELTENETHALNMETCGANNDINLAEQTHVEFCDECDNKLEIAVADFATETFNAEEEFKKAELNFNDALANKRAEIKRNKAVQDNTHRQNLAVIENKFDKLGSDADTRYKQLSGELKALFSSFDGYYNTLNKFNGTGVAVLSSVAESLESARGDLAMPAEKAYSLFDTVVNIYNRDCGKQGTGVLDDKLAKLAACAAVRTDALRSRKGIA